MKPKPINFIPSGLVVILSSFAKATCWAWFKFFTWLLYVSRSYYRHFRKLADPALYDIELWGTPFVFTNECYSFLHCSQKIQFPNQIIPFSWVLHASPQANWVARDHLVIYYRLFRKLRIPDRYNAKTLKKYPPLVHFALYFHNQVTFQKSESSFFFSFFYHDHRCWKYKF